MRLKIVIHIPIEDAPRMRQALGDAGAGTIGEYSHCSFSIRGIGRFKPSAQANPHIGTAGEVEEVKEESIEVVCDRKDAKHIIHIIRQTHPYEEPAYEIIQLLDEQDL